MKDHSTLPSLSEAVAQSPGAAAPSSKAPGLNLARSVRMRTLADAQVWQRLYDALPYPHLPQGHSYGEGKSSSGLWHPVRLVFERGAREVAICQALEVRVGGLRIATRINRGPVFFDVEPSWADREEVMRAVRQHWRLGRGAPLLIAPALSDCWENRLLMSSLGFRARRHEGWCSALIDLHQSEDAIRRRFTSVWRNRLKAALASGLTLSTENDAQALEWLLDRHEENMRAKGFSGPRRALLRALHANSSDDYRVLRAFADGQAVGGLILARFGCAAEYYVGWFGEEGRKRNCGNFLYWNALCEARKAGHRWFDLGGYYSNDKFGRFKQNMRGTEYRLCGEWIGL